MNEELKQIITGLILFAVLIAIAMFIAGGKNDADVSSDYENQEGQYYEGGGVGHPLWK